MLDMLRSSRVTFVKLYFSEHIIHGLPKIRIMPFYAVAKGRNTGIYHSWADCEAQVKGFSGAKFKKFDTVSNANEFINTNSCNGGYASRSSYSNGQSSSGYNLKRSYATSSRDYTYSQNDDSDSQSSESSLDAALTKHMDNLEKRVDSFSKGLDKITKSSSRSGVARRTILIEPPQSKKFRSNMRADFEEDNEGYVQVYTDGACAANGQHGARAGLGVFWGDDHELNTSRPVSGRATNNCGEIQAATEAIKTAVDKGIKKLTINTDSQFLIKAATEWLPGWKRRGWKLASGERVKNEIDFKELDRVKDKVQIKWNYVKAHNGQHGNEMADRLAKAGAANYNKK